MQGTKSFWKTVGTCFVWAVSLFSLVMVWECILSNQQYVRVYQDPLYVDATITHITVFVDSDDETTYTSFVSYEAKGQQYQDIKYDSDDEREDLEPEGTVLRLAVDPREPAQLMKDITVPWLVVPFGVILAIAVTSSISKLRQYKLSKDDDCGICTDLIAEDLIIAIRARKARVFWLLAAGGLFALVKMFPMLYGTGYLVAGVICAVFWLICMYTTLRDSRQVREGEFRMQYERLVRKETVQDSEGNRQYYLHYSSPLGERKQFVGRDAYDNARIGTSERIVYLSNSKQPLLRYVDGAAKMI